MGQLRDKPGYNVSEGKGQLSKTYRATTGSIPSGLQRRISFGHLSSLEVRLDENDGEGGDRLPFPTMVVSTQKHLRHVRTLPRCPVQVLESGRTALRRVPRAELLHVDVVKLAHIAIEELLLLAVLKIDESKMNLKQRNQYDEDKQKKTLTAIVVYTAMGTGIILTGSSSSSSSS